MSGFCGGSGLKLIFSAALALATLGGAREARADVQHVVAKGHTLGAIARRYHVSAKAIMEANGLKNAKRLKIGEVLTIPMAGGATSAKAGASAAKAPPHATKPAKPGKGKKAETSSKPKTYKERPKTPWVIHLRRAGTKDDADIRVRDAKGKVPGSAMRAFEKSLRSGAGAKHPIEPRLITLLGIVSNHFGSRRIEVVSGFRPFTTTQYNPHSNHNHGRAIDFRVTGVPNDVVRDFCRTLKKTGCGYYPNSTFIHLDTRAASTFWIDYSRPGEAPRYNAPGLDADDATNDVHADSADAVNTATPDAPPATEASDADHATKADAPKSDATKADAPKSDATKSESDAP